MKSYWGKANKVFVGDGISDFKMVFALDVIGNCK